MRTVVDDGAVIAHAAIPGGITHIVPGGLVTSGRWPFVSGSNVATWIFLSTMVPGAAPDWVPTPAIPEPPKEHNRWLLVPAQHQGFSIEMAGLAARENAQRAVDRLFSIRGAHGLLEWGDFERYYRDVRMGTLHAVTAPDLVRELVGKHLFGVPSGETLRWG